MCFYPCQLKTCFASLALGLTISKLYNTQRWSEILIENTEKLYYAANKSADLTFSLSMISLNVAAIVKSVIVLGH